MLVVINLPYCYDTVRWLGCRETFDAQKSASPDFKWAQSGTMTELDVASV